MWRRDACAAAAVLLLEKVACLPLGGGEYHVVWEEAAGTAGKLSIALEEEGGYVLCVHACAGVPLLSPPHTHLQPSFLPLPPTTTHHLTMALGRMGDAGECLISQASGRRKRGGRQVTASPPPPHHLMRALGEECWRGWDMYHHCHLPALMEGGCCSAYCCSCLPL